MKKIALITGASSGIGRAISIALSQSGYSVIIHYHSNKRKADEVLKICNEFSSENMIVQADISNESEIKKMFQEISQMYSHIDVLVNNAGIFDETDNPYNLEAFERIYKNNFLGAVIVTKYAVEVMEYGCIVNISSIHGKLWNGSPEAIAYAAMKAALESYTKNLAKDLAPKIRVNAIAPGRVNTPMWGIESEQEKKRLGEVHLIERMIEPEEIADAVKFLIQNSAICWEILVVDGGMSLVTLG